jgi:hypothetical protein
MTEERFELVKGRHFSVKGLCSWLNKEYSHKLIQGGRGKTAWNINDIHQYLLPDRGLPEYINGKNKLTEHQTIGGIRIVELLWEQ